jgi:hypothetical protein
MYREVEMKTLKEEIENFKSREDDAQNICNILGGEVPERIFQDEFNPLHLYAHLRCSMNLPKPIASSLAEFYNEHIYKPALEAYNKQVR